MWDTTCLKSDPKDVHILLNEARQAREHDQTLSDYRGGKINVDSNGIINFYCHGLFRIA